MQPKHNDKHDAKSATPVDPRLYRYEQEKREWIKAHPTSSQRQYEQAMRDIAKRCGV